MHFCKIAKHFRITMENENDIECGVYSIYDLKMAKMLYKAGKGMLKENDLDRALFYFEEVLKICFLRTHDKLDEPRGKIQLKSFNYVIKILWMQGNEDEMKSLMRIMLTYERILSQRVTSIKRKSTRHNRSKRKRKGVPITFYNIHPNNAKVDDVTFVKMTLVLMKICLQNGEEHWATEYGNMVDEASQRKNFGAAIKVSFMRYIAGMYLLRGNEKKAIAYYNKAAAKLEDGDMKNQISE